ncbi:MAG: hypothetical protein Q9186_001146 [Xanthomendoza sp. 1 TL-2023]
MPTIRRSEFVQRPVQQPVDGIIMRWPLASLRKQRHQRPQRPPRLLRIPAELREQVYSELLHDHPSSLSGLLTVNKQISGEVLPWILKRPLTFDGQQCLFNWLSCIDPGYLPNVVGIRLNLHDIDPEKIMGALGERLRRAREQSPDDGLRSPYLEACDLETTKIMNALRLFKNLRSFTLLSNTSADPHPDSEMISMLVTSVIEDLPLVLFRAPAKMLHEINPMTVARGDNSYSSQIPDLQITNYKFGKLQGLPRYLQSFPNLRNLEICGADSSTFNGRSYSSSPLHQFAQLERLTLCLYHYRLPIPLPRTRHSIYDPIEQCMVALQETPSPMKMFKLLCNRSFDRDCGLMHQFLRFLQSSSLNYIETSVWWAPLPDQYPKSIKTIAIRFENNYVQYGDWLQKLSNVIDPAQSTFLVDHPHLKEITFYLASEARGKLGNLGIQHARLAAAYKELGIQVKVCFRDFRCEHHH